MEYTQYQYNIFLLSTLFFCITMSMSILGCIATKSKIKKILCMSVAQTSIICLYLISTTRAFKIIKSNSETDPIILNSVDPLAQVLMLTAIVVGFSTTILLFILASKSKREDILD